MQGSDKKKAEEWGEEGGDGRSPYQELWNQDKAEHDARRNLALGVVIPLIVAMFLAWAAFAFEGCYAPATENPTLVPQPSSAEEAAKLLIPSVLPLITLVLTYYFASSQK